MKDLHSIYLRPTATYWVPVLAGNAPVLDDDGNILEISDHRLKKLQISPREDVELAVAVIGGKLSYLWWSIVGDDLDITLGEFDIPRRSAQRIAFPRDKYHALIEDVKSAIRRAIFVSVNAEKHYINIRWSRIRQATDPIDRAIVDSLGGTDEDWRNINILYRQVMRSSGDSAKGRYLTQAEIDEYLDW